jgi:putative tricarboxylic transport membrane protein
MRINDVVLGLLIVAIALAVIWFSLALPTFPGERYGAAVFPSIVAALMGGCGLIVAWRGYRAGTVSTRDADALVVDRRALTNLGVTGVAIVVYVFAFNPVGFIVATTGLLLVLFVLLRVRVVPAAFAALAVTLVVAFLFIDVLRVPLPWGVLGPLLG